MTVTINGEKQQIKDARTIQELLAELAYDAESKVAVARNTVFVPRASYASEELKDGDTIDIVAPMQGG